MCTSDFSPASFSPISSSLLPPPVRVRCVCSPGLLCSSFLTVYFSMSIYLRNPCTSDTRIHLSANLQHISRQVFLSSWYFCLKYQVLYSQRMSSPPLTMATSVMHAHHLPPSVILGPGFSRWCPYHWPQHHWWTWAIQTPSPTLKMHFGNMEGLTKCPLLDSDDKVPVREPYLRLINFVLKLPITNHQPGDRNFCIAIVNTKLLWLIKVCIQVGLSHPNHAQM
jgi:hypothetical protein